MTVDYHDDADNGIQDDTLSKILGASSMVASSLDLDLAFGTVDFNVDPACTPLLSPLSPLSSPLLLLLLLLGSPSEIQEFSLFFSPIGGCLIIRFSFSLCNAVGLLILLKLCPVCTFLQQLMTKTL